MPASFPQFVLLAFLNPFDAPCPAAAADFIISD
jgi:hypothetical protein